MTVFPIVPDFERYPDYGRDMPSTFGGVRLAHSKGPNGFHFVNGRPKTATGKVQKFILRGRKAGIAAQ